jgi:hypothetical protein
MIHRASRSARRRAHAFALAGLLAAAALPGCSTTAFHQRERLAHPAMQFDRDESVDYLRTKMEAAREGAFGRFGPVAAGGCGCQ